MSIEEVAELLAAIGCPPEKSAEMARMLAKRADQLAQQRGQSYEDALTHLLGLMRQGGSAKAKGGSSF